MKKFFLPVTFFLALLFPIITAAADQNKNIDESINLYKLQKVLEESESLLAQSQAIARKRYNDCMAAFGHENFCSCLNKELSWILSFQSYVNIIVESPTRTLNNTAHDEQMVIESVYKAREKCIKCFE